MPAQKKRNAAPAADLKGRGRVGPLGTRLRAIRKARGLTLQDVADRSSLSVSTLSKVESGKLSLSYHRLIDLSNGLNIDIRQLFEKPEEARTTGDANGATGAVTARRSVARRADGMELFSKNNNYRVLFEEVRQKKLSTAVIRVKANSLEEYGELTCHEGEEVVFVLDGRVVFHTEYYEPVTLEQGDAIFIDSTMGHGFTNEGDSEATVFTVMSASFDSLLDSPLMLQRAPARAASSAPQKKSK